MARIKYSRRAPAPTSIPVTLGRAVQVRSQRPAGLPLDGLGGPVPSVAGEESAGVEVSGESRRAVHAAGPRERQFRADAVGEESFSRPRAIARLGAYNRKMTVAAMQMALKKVCVHRSYRVAMGLQSLSLPNMCSITLRRLQSSAS